MDFLKYVDILIGLAVVMVLLSPLVTAITQLILVISRRRSGLLRDGIRDLILHLATNPLNACDRIRIASAPRMKFKVADAVSGETDGNGVCICELRAGALGGRPQVEFQGAKDSAVKLAFLPRASMTDQVVRKDLQAGSAVIPYVFAGAAEAYTSCEGSVRIIDNLGTPDPACLVKLDFGPDLGAPNDLHTGRDFTYPKVPAPLKYDIKVTVTDSNGAPPKAGYQVELQFRRNDGYDLLLRPNKTDQLGKAVFELPESAQETLTCSAAGRVATAVLEHPMIGTPGLLSRFVPKFKEVGKRRFLRSLGGPVMGNCIEREELTRILLELAGGEGVQATALSREDQASLQRVLSTNDIPNARRSLAAIRDKSQELEKTHPEMATHAREAQATLEAASSAFVGKINNWFDQMVDRVTQRYAQRARMITIGSAAFVALSMQFDSLDLLKRLSTDDKLRAALVDEAKNQQAHIDKLTGIGAPGAPAPALATNELADANAKMAELEQSLSTLRSPQLSVLPDRFIWHKPSRARLDQNPKWDLTSLPAKLYLVLGPSTFEISPDWAAPPLQAIRAAIDKSGAPVASALEARPTEDQLIVRSKAPSLTLTAKIQSKTKDSKPIERPLLNAWDEEKLTTIFNPKKWPTGWPAGASTTVELVAGMQSRVIAVHLDGTATEGILATAITTKGAGLGLNADWKPAAKTLTVSGAKPEIKPIELRWLPGAEGTNVLDPEQAVLLTFRMTRNSIPEENLVGILLNGKDLCGKSGKSCPDQLEKLRDAINDAPHAPAAATIQPSYSMTLTPRRGSTVELRFSPNNPQSNILNTYLEPDPFSPARDILPVWRGLVLSWLLLSLGAPFWYDALKDLLKLRPTLASKEEQQRADRQADNSKPANTSSAQTPPR